MNPVKFVFWIGPTAVGKSGLALATSEKFSGARPAGAMSTIPILNADSVQTYKKVDIGSAKPSSQDMARAPHFLFDVISPPETMTAGEYNRRFYDWVEKEGAQYPIAFVVGGTGFYFQAIEKGLLPIPPANAEVQAELFRRLEIEGENALHAELLAADPESGARIHPRDHYRLVRALDIIHATGKAPSQILKEHSAQAHFPFPLLKIGLQRPKEEMAKILRRRTEQMLAAGWLDEVKALLAEGLSSWEPLSSVGYKECVQYLKGEILTEAALIQAVVDSSLRLQKKQKTWFQRDPEIHWFSPNDTAGVEALVGEFIASNDLQDGV